MSELMIREEGFISPATSMDTAVQRYSAMRDFIANVLRNGTDYGTIPGAGDKPTLLKPGAEKLASFFGLSSSFVLVDKEQDWTGKDHNGEPFFYYWYKCVLSRGGVHVAEGEGSANSMEKKYRYRSANLKCPNCGNETIIKGKEEYGGGWVCFAKKGGCGAKFKDGDSRIENQPRGQVLNPDIADVVNTLQKMAQKRALVAAVLIGTNASDYFTQDIEDMSFGNAGIIDAEFVEITEREQPKTQPRQPKTAQQAAATLGFDPRNEPVEETDGKLAKVQALVNSLKSLDDDSVTVSDKQRNLLRHMIDDVVFQDNNAHHMLFKMLYNDPSVKTISGGAVKGMIDWLKPVKDEDSGEYSTDKVNALHAMLRYAEQLDGQLALFAEQPA